LRVREVEVRASDTGIPPPDEPALKEMLGRAIRERSGELFSGGAISAT
jgi:hypothetical protein